MIKALFAVVAVGIGALLLYAASKPDTFMVQRSTSIKAPPEQVHSLINDLHQFNTWNPYQQKDPNIKGSYRGPASGLGAAYDFEGNQDVGKGSIEITATQADQVDMRLDMTEPMEVHNAIEFKLLPQSDGTLVTWTTRGPATFLYKLVGLVMNMDQMIGRDFETGLNNLKAQAERRAP